MKVWAVRIAAELGISKATVSLALNDRPGVSSETRRRTQKDFPSATHEKKRSVSGAIMFGSDQEIGKLPE